MISEKWTDLIIYDVNPWVNPSEDGKYEVIQNNKTTTITSLSDSDILINNDKDSKLFLSKEKVSASEFIKVYANMVGTSLKLSSTAIHLFVYLTTKLEFNNDKIYFKVKEAMESMGYKSMAPIYTALKELADADIIARTRDNRELFINPAVFHKGNKFVFAKAIEINQPDLQIPPELG